MNTPGTRTHAVLDPNGNLVDWVLSYPGNRWGLERQRAIYDTPPAEYLEASGAIPFNDITDEQWITIGMDQ